MLGRAILSAAIWLGLLGCGDTSGAVGAKPTSTTSASSPAPPSASAALPSASAVAPARIAAQHVLIGYQGTKVGTAKRSKEEARQLAEEVRKKAIDGADFAKLAEQYSDDPASKERLGSVGTFDREGMVKPFSDAAFSLKVNEVSPVVETYFGFHVIKRNQ